MATGAQQRSFPKVTYGANPSAEDRYWITGTDDRATARAQAITSSPLVIDGMLRNSLAIEQTDNNNVWDARLQYGIREVPSAEFAKWVLSTKGATAKVSHSLSTINSYAIDGRTAGVYNNSIGVTDRGIDGVDIVIGKLSLTLTTYVAEDLLDARYRNTLLGLTGTVNSDKFFGFKPGEVLFLGCDAERTDVDQETQELLVRLVYEFALEPNRTAALGNPITGIGSLPDIDKDGHDYLWIRSEDFEDKVAKLKVKIPAEAHVERVYRREKFRALGLNGIL